MVVHLWYNEFVITREDTSNAKGWPVTGHEWAVDLLRRSLDADRLPHALLLTGPRQVGKRTLALALVSALFCQAENRPCGECRACVRVAHGNHPDVQVVEATVTGREREGVLRIDQIRLLRREAALAPLEAPLKIFVLREIEHANLPAANALLKTLEEPPDRVMLILTSARPDALLSTIISRCQTVQLRPLAIEIVRQALINDWQVSEEEAALLARLSRGRLGWAVERLEDETAWQERVDILDESFELTGKGPTERLKFAANLARTPGRVQPTLDLWASWWRDLLLMQTGCSDQISNIDLEARLGEQVHQFDTSQVRHFLARLQAAPGQLNRNVNARLLLENLVLHMPEPEQGGLID
ncbi:MAG: DNA polymerase III subunit delta' [Chloroflexota bacterium]|nr:DNA polymerase III subunit delta' [Chloroflexota bacterium]